ncbi:MAG: haloalkane dehalogenase [Pseudomonadota bacterium]
MHAVTTDPARFNNLPDYPFAPNFVDVDGLAMHFVDEGPRSARVMLMLHGEPSWSYLYRHMIPPAVAAGYRVVAPDLIGFGKSAKPTRVADYSYQQHMDWLSAFVAALELDGIVLICQDWGSLLGLRLAAEQEERFAAIVLANGGLPTGDHAMPKAFKIWQRFARYSPWFPIGKIIDRGTTTELASDVIAAYDAPFPGGRYKAGARAFPRLVPSQPDDPASVPNRAAWEVFKRWEKPFATAFSDKDPITRGMDRMWQSAVPGARHDQHTVIRGGGHFLQEDRGPELAAFAIQYCAANGLGP